LKIISNSALLRRRRFKNNFKQSDFVWEINNPNGITFGNLVEGVYLMKCSKYDLWYELFGGIKIINEDDDSYTFEVSFDYCS
jgi:hypothetical protein